MSRTSSFRPQTRSGSIHGVSVIVKPVGMTSHDVVDAIRAIVGTRRVGHTGTLDPGASGVLVLTIGRATRIAEFLAEADKEYRVEITFGRATDSGDAYGQVLYEVASPRLDASQLLAVLPSFTGEIEQVPPMASAVHVAGRRLYELARSGEAAEVSPRRVHIYRLDLLEFTANPPKALLHATCSKGTYIRKLCHDIGVRLGAGAYASFMVRTRVGRYTLDAASTLEELRTLKDRHQLEDVVHTMDEAMGDLPAVDLLPPHRQAVMHGQPLPLFKVANWRELLGARAVRLRDAEGLVALARVEEGLLKPFKVLRDS